MLSGRYLPKAGSLVHGRFGAVAVGVCRRTNGMGLGFGDFRGILVVTTANKVTPR